VYEKSIRNTNKYTMHGTELMEKLIKQEFVRGGKKDKSPVE
jgi:hypothetical protein